MRRIPAATLDFAQDFLKQPIWAVFVNMGAAAELRMLQPPASTTRTTLAVLLAKQSHSAHLLGFLNGQVRLGDHGRASQNFLVDAALDLGQLFGVTALKWVKSKRVIWSSW